jgi:5-(carboxyamino)imidazole ribonucleotide synthase
LDGASVIEKLVSIDKEISVMLGRNEKGEMKVFPPVEMEFNAEANLVEMLIAPARIRDELSKKAMELGESVANSLNLVGVIAVEMFLTKEGNLLINESAPRPHNSGHHTIEANESSQYEQLIRAILGLPLGNTSQISNAIMINVLGSKGQTGEVNYKNVEDVMKTRGAHLHIYGKKQTKPFRKMGHITLCGEDLNSLIEEGNRLKKVLQVEAK